MVSVAATGTDLVLAWDVEDGGRLGAVIECRPCHGAGVVPEDHGIIGVRPEFVACQECSGSGKLHRPYTLPEAVEPTGDLYVLQAAGESRIRIGCRRCGQTYDPAEGDHAAACFPVGWADGPAERNESARSVLTGDEQPTPTGLGAEPASAMLDALDAAVDLMVQRIKVLRRVARVERERMSGSEVPAPEGRAEEWH